MKGERYSPNCFILHLDVISSISHLRIGNPSMKIYSSWKQEWREIYPSLLGTILHIFRVLARLFYITTTGNMNWIAFLIQCLRRSLLIMMCEKLSQTNIVYSKRQIWFVLWNCYNWKRSIRIYQIQKREFFIQREIWRKISWKELRRKNLFREYNTMLFNGVLPSNLARFDHSGVR